MSKKIRIRYEPFIGDYLAMEEGVFYRIDSERIGELLEAEPDCIVTRQGSHPPGVFSVPLKVQIQATELCNLRCITCAATHGHLSPGRSTAELKHVLEILGAVGVLNIEWSGGEPLLRRDFPEVVEYAHQLGFAQNILTNGILFDDAIAKMASSRFFRTQVSLDGIGELFDQIVGRKAWKRFERGLATVVNAGTPNKVVATVLQECNVASMEEIIRYVAGSKVDKHRISMQFPGGRSSGLTWKRYSEVIDAFRKQWPRLKEIATRAGLAIDCFLEKEECLDPGVPDVGSIVSPGGYSLLYIDAKGDVYPFPFLVGPELKLGSIFRDTIESMWFGSPVLQQLRRQTYRNTGCGDCRLECSFAERYLVYAFTGDFSAPALDHPECPKKRR